MPVKAIISGLGGSHDDTAKAAFLAATGLSSGDVIMTADVPGGKTDWQYAAEQGIGLIVRSTNDVAAQSATVLQYYKSHNILTCMAFPDATGSGNAHTEYTGLAGKVIAVTIGAGILSAVQNGTGYGQGLWFWAREGYGTVGSPESSYGNPVGAGALYTVKTALGCTWWEALMRCALTAGTWDKYNGFGRIDTAAAIAFTGPVPPDLFNGSQTVADDGQSVQFAWTKGAAKTRIVTASDGQVIYEGTGSSLTWASTKYGTETFKFYGVDASGNVSADQSFTQATLSGLNVYQLATPAPSSSVSQVTATIAWSAIQYASQYVVQRSEDDGATWQTIATTTALTANETMESMNLGYRFRVKATGSGYTDSAWGEVFAGRFGGSGMLSNTAIL